MTTATDRLDLRLETRDKNRIRRAAALRGVPVAAFVRDAALREARAVTAQAASPQAGSLSARLRGRATAGMSTNEIMRHTRGA